MPLFFIIIVSCTYAVSKETIKEASDVPFRTVRENIEDYVGKQFVWGGFIARNRLTDEGTYLEVVQNPTNRYGRVVDTDMSEGQRGGSWSSRSGRWTLSSTKRGAW
jgi:starvation-inducible outer membrane lipoprotein